MFDTQGTDRTQELVKHLDTALSEYWDGVSTALEAQLPGLTGDEQPAGGRICPLYMSRWNALRKKLEGHPHLEELRSAWTPADTGAGPTGLEARQVGKTVWDITEGCYKIRDVILGTLLHEADELEMVQKGVLRKREDYAGRPGESVKLALVTIGGGYRDARRAAQPRQPDLPELRPSLPGQNGPGDTSGRSEGLACPQATIGSEWTMRVTQSSGKVGITSCLEAVETLLPEDDIGCPPIDTVDAPATPIAANINILSESTSLLSKAIDANGKLLMPKVLSANLAMVARTREASETQGWSLFGSASKLRQIVSLPTAANIKKAIRTAECYVSAHSRETALPDVLGEFWAGFRARRSQEYAADDAILKTVEADIPEASREAIALVRQRLELDMQATDPKVYSDLESGKALRKARVYDTYVFASASEDEFAGRFGPVGRLYGLRRQWMDENVDSGQKVTLHAQFTEEFPAVLTDLEEAVEGNRRQLTEAYQSWGHDVDALGHLPPDLATVLSASPHLSSIANDISSGQLSCTRSVKSMRNWEYSLPGTTMFIG
jgi:hypothetical protein